MYWTYRFTLVCPSVLLFAKSQLFLQRCCFTVALNYQTPGLMMDLYNGWFLKNGNCGFVLKPSIMREEIAYFSANTKDVIPGVSPQILHIKVCFTVIVLYLNQIYE